MKELPRFRLQNQQLAGSHLKTGRELVRWFGAVQGQEYAQTKWGLGLRLPHLQDADIEQELNEGSLLRTHVLRPTWHFVAAEDIRWILALTAPRVHAANAFMYRKLELDDSVFERCNTLIEKVLQGGQHRTREEINAAFQKNGIEASGLRLGYIMMQAELDGLICSGDRKGNQPTYALLEERVPAAPSKTREESLAELTRRYFSSRGPATLQDFSTWSGLTPADCKKGVEMLSPELTLERIDTQDFYLFPTAEKKHVETAHLLPVYDELIMGYKDRSAFFQQRNSLEPKPTVRYDNMVLLGDQVAGTWKRTLRGKTMEIGYDFFRPPTEQQRDLLEKAGQHLQAFSGLKVLAHF